MDLIKKNISSLTNKYYPKDGQPDTLYRAFFRQIFLLTTIWVVLLILRVPILANANFFLDPDEGFMATHMVEAIKSGNFSLYYERVQYAGNFNGYLALPFFLIMGFTALAYKLPAVLCYGLYVWTFYLLAKKYRKDIALTVVIFMVFAPPHLLDLSTRNYPHLIVGILGNFLFLLADQIIKKKHNNTKIFFLGLVVGFSIYVYSYSVIYIATVFIILFLGNPNWHTWRGDSSLISFLNPFKNCNNIKQIILRIIDIVIGGLYFGIFLFLFFKYIWGGIIFEAEPLVNKFLIFFLIPNDATTPLLLIYPVIIFVRIYLYRKKNMRFYSVGERLTEKSKKICFALVGFLVGFCPNIIGTLNNQISGHPGFEFKLSLTHMFSKFMDIWVTISSLTGINKPFIDVNSFELSSPLIFLRIFLATFIALLGIASFVHLIFSQRCNLKKFFQLKQIDQNPPLILILLFLVIILAGSIYLKINSSRHFYPIYGILCFSAAIFIHIINQRIRGNKFLKTCTFFWILFCIIETHTFYVEAQVIKGVHVDQRESKIESLIQHLRSDNIKLVYSDYWLTHKAHFIGLANPEFIEYYASSVRGLARKKRAEDKFDFAFVFSTLNDIKVFEKILQDYRIICKVENFGRFVIYKNFEGMSHHLRAIKKLPIDLNSQALRN
jgi:hypothetical protein